MTEVSLSVETRTGLGSPESRRQRRADRIPAVVYGMGHDPISLAVERSDFRRAMTTDAGVNALIQLSVDGGSSHATLVKQIQRHPVRRDVTHIDFIRIDPEQFMVLDVPIVMNGDAKKVTTAGGIIDQRLSQLRVLVRPDSIPTQINAPIAGMEIDQVLTVGQLVLPPGVTTDVDLDKPVITAELTRAAVMALHSEDDENGAVGDEAAADS